LEARDADARDFVVRESMGIRRSYYKIRHAVPNFEMVNE